MPITKSKKLIKLFDAIDLAANHLGTTSTVTFGSSPSPESQSPSMLALASSGAGGGVSSAQSPGCGSDSDTRDPHAALSSGVGQDYDLARVVRDACIELDLTESERRAIEQKIRMLYLLPTKTRKQFNHEIHKYLAWATATFGSGPESNSHIITPLRVCDYIQHLMSTLDSDSVREGKISNGERSAMSMNFRSHPGKTPSRAKMANLRGEPYHHQRQQHSSNASSSSSEYSTKLQVYTHLSTRVNLIVSALSRYWDMQNILFGDNAPPVTDAHESQALDGIYTREFVKRSSLSDYKSVSLKQRQLRVEHVFKLTTTIPNVKTEPSAKETSARCQENEARISELVSQLQKMHEYTMRAMQASIRRLHCHHRT